MDTALQKCLYLYEHRLTQAPPRRSGAGYVVDRNMPRARLAPARDEHGHVIDQRGDGNGVPQHREPRERPRKARGRRQQDGDVIHALGKSIAPMRDVPPVAGGEYHRVCCAKHVRMRKQGRNRACEEQDT